MEKFLSFTGRKRTVAGLALAAFATAGAAYGLENMDSGNDVSRSWISYGVGHDLSQDNAAAAVVQPSAIDLPDEIAGLSACTEEEKDKLGAIDTAGTSSFTLQYSFELLNKFREESPDCAGAYTNMKARQSAKALGIDVPPGLFRK